MGSPPAEQNGTLRAVLLAAVMLLALAPQTPVAGQSPADNHQAHGISATFDTVTETTTVTWANQVSTDITVLSNMFTSTYNVYRHTAPINTSNLAGLTPFATVDVCSMAAAGGNPGYCSGTTIQDMPLPTRSPRGPTVCSTTPSPPRSPTGVKWRICCPMNRT